MGTRITPDGYDIVVWKLDEAAAPFVNSSTSTSAPSHPVSDLATLSGTLQLQQPSPFAASGANSCVRFTASNSGSPRNFISGANNVEFQSPFTISWWMFLRRYNNAGFVQHIVNKQHTAGVWSGGTFSVITQQNQSTGSSTYSIYSNGLTGTPTYWTMPLNVWCHVGMVFDGSNTYNYLNGTLVQQWAATGPLNWGGHGPWFIGAIPSGSGNPEESAVSVSDIRIANVARDLAYFRNIYNSGGTAAGYGEPFVVYNKLRAYDLSCSTPTPVYWISTSIDYTNAPTPPCGSLGPIEVVETWPVLGFGTGTALTIHDALNGLSWLLPNTGNISTFVCSTLNNAETDTIIPGDGSTTYNVTLRFRGVIEEKTYSGGTNDGAWFQTGGTPAVDNYNVYALIVSNPPQTYYLNRGTSGQNKVYGIDYTKTIPMNGFATITLLAQSIDNQEIKNQDGTGNNPISISGITNPAQPYNGQFIQMGVISVT